MITLVKRWCLWFACILMAFEGIAFAAPPIPARIGGIVTVDNIQLTGSLAKGYSFIVTSPSRKAFFEGANDSDGLNSSNWYVINIPISDAGGQPNGARPGEIVEIHVYKGPVELKIHSPKGGRFVVGRSGSATRIDIVAEIPKNN